MYFVTDGGIQFVDDDYKPITIDEALISVRRVAAWVEAIGNEPKRNGDAEIAMDRGAQPAYERTEAA